MKEPTEEAAGAMATESEESQLLLVAEVVQIPLDKLVESLTNPRQTFDEEKLSELAESIRQFGIRQPLTVRPCSGRLVERLSGKVTFEGDEQTYEIVIGARRYRAAKKAGLETVPCIIDATMSDREASEIQIVENLQRDDIGAIEEGGGFKRLMEAHNLTAKEIADKVGKSVRYVYDRLSLVDRLHPGVMALHSKGLLSASHLVELARLSESDQESAVLQCCDEYTKGLDELAKDSHEFRSFSLQELKEHIEQEIQHSLKSAGWDLDDEALFPKAGACSACALRSDREIDQIGKVEGKDGSCMRPECYSEKKTAFLKKQAGELKQDNEKLVVVQSVYGRRNEECAKAAGLMAPMSPYQFEKAKKTDKGAVKALDIATGKPMWIKTGEKVAQRDDERAEQNAKRKKELEREREIIDQRQHLMAAVLKRIPENNKGVVSTIVQHMGWNMNRDKEAAHRRVLWMAGDLGKITEDESKGIDLHAAIEDLTRDGGPECLARLMVLWHCREEFYHALGGSGLTTDGLLNDLAKVLNIDSENLEKKPEAEARDEASIPATVIAAKVKKAKGKKKKGGKKSKR